MDNEKPARWIQKAIGRPGALTAKAKAAHMPLSKFISKATRAGSKASETTKRQANLAKTLKSFGK